ncbi:hypothetical protein SAMN05216388_100720 [Halorientalis persicus]|uniref:Uncharacterized protein n=1 Tax=Halorientalis persicus TaxID=1367881 RepID=A0A1H8L5C7_9EURY|nr:hypothetical protein SAMN05216388_100720 [Halorientalis persicus]
MRATIDEWVADLTDLVDEAQASAARSMLRWRVLS